jgi:nitroimidazol reductase NimA-like FMN-containing flavoprotein (pyridoxamine 5'-phosphate oxidase superfamily)
MLVHQLTDDECREFLKQTNLGRLACSRDDQPYIVPIYFDFDGADVYSFAIRGTKIAWMESNSKVCLEVDDILDQYNWTSVLVFGQYEELVESPEYEELRARARQLFQKRPEWWLPAAGKVPAHDEQVPVVYRIRPASMNGRRAVRHETAAAAAARRARPPVDAGPPWWVEVLNPVLGKRRC